MTGENCQQTVLMSELAASVVDVEADGLQKLGWSHASFTRLAGHDDMHPLAQRLMQAGAIAIAQGEKTCVVHGMLRDAIEMDAVDVVAPLDRISEEILGTFNKLQSAVR